jgi:WD40 repeat protein
MMMMIKNHLMMSMMMTMKPLPTLYWPMNKTRTLLKMPLASMSNTQVWQHNAMGHTCCECLIRCCCCCSDSIYSVDARVLPTGPQGSEEVRVVSGGGDDVARVWNPRTGKTFFTLAGHADTVLDVKFNHDSMMIATASMDGTVRVWDSITGALHSVLEGPSDSLDVCWYFTTMLPISYTQLVSLSLSWSGWLASCMAT